MECFDQFDIPMSKPQMQPLSNRDGHWFLKVAAQVLLSMTVFSAVFLLYSAVFLVRLKVYFPAYNIESLSYNYNKNFMFLLCNGILVVLFKNSSLIKKSSACSLSCCKTDTSAGSLPGAEADEVTSAKVITLEKQHNAGAPVMTEIQVDNDMEFENEILVTDDRNEDEIDEEEDDFEKMSREELNRKCEDFIKKMRGEISFEYISR